MPNLYNAISYYSKHMDKVKVHIMRIENKFGYTFTLNGKDYGNFFTAKSLTKEEIDQLTVMLEGTARNAIKHLKTTC